MLQRIRDRGALYLAGVAICKVLPVWVGRVRYFSIYELRPDDTRPKVSDAPLSSRGVLVPCKTDADQQRLAQICKTRVSPDLITEGWAFEVEGDWVGGVWMADGQFLESELGLTIELPENVRWLFSAYVVKDFRRQGLYTRMVNELLSQFPPNTRVVAAISDHNRASLAAHHRLIDERIAKVRCIRLFGYSVSWSVPQHMTARNRFRLPDPR